MVMLRLTAEQYRKLPILVDESTCAGKTYVITGGNSGLGLETARHLVAASATTVVLAVRNLSAGEVAKADIESGRERQANTGTLVMKVRHLDLSTYAAVQVFAKQISQELDRIDGFVCNAGIMMDHWETLEGSESSIFVNVVNTLFLGALMMPKLSESLRRFGVKPTLVFIVSVLGYTVKAEMDKSRNGGVFDGLNDQKRANMNSRYALTKLVEECAVRQFAAQFPVDRTGVVITMVAPGLCNTGLGRDASTFTKIMHEAIRVLMARTAEVGSRTILHGLVVGEEGHGKLQSGCKIKEFWVPDWLNNDGGQRLQKAIWKELVAKLELTPWAATMSPALVFIEQNVAGIGKSDRRALRSHVMRGKNAGRPRPSTRRQTTIVPIKRFLDISDALFPPQFCYKFNILKSIWVNYILVDEAYFHSTLAVSASYIDFFERKPTTSSKTLHHICQAYSLVNLKLSGPHAISDSAIAAVVTLAIYQQVHQQHSIGLVHLRGLHRMIELRGGIARLMKGNRLLALKPLSQDVPVTAVLCDSSPVAAQLSACSPGLPRIMLDLIVFAGILNDKAKNARSKLNPL
ncbi:short-chain dehydrogenase, partial [Colletotrichum musicola]